MVDNGSIADNGDNSARGGEQEPIAAAEPTAAPVLKTRWRDRAWTFRAMLAVAAASVLIGGIVGGGVVAAATHGDDGDRRMQRWGPGPGGSMPPGWRGHGPKWRWDQGPGPGSGNPMTPYGNGGGMTPQPPTPPPPSTPPSPGATS